MQWQRFSRKKNGDLRKRFDQWGIPKEIRDKLGLEDGSRCRLGFRIGANSPRPIKMLAGSGAPPPEKVHLKENIASCFTPQGCGYGLLAGYFRPPTRAISESLLTSSFPYTCRISWMAQPLHTPADSLLLLTGQPAGGEL